MSESTPRLPSMLFWVRFLNAMKYTETRWFSSRRDAMKFHAKHAGSRLGTYSLGHHQRSAAAEGGE